MLRATGAAASPGIAIGPVWVYRPVSLNPQEVAIDDTAAELGRLQQALTAAGTQLERLQVQAEEAIGSHEAEIFGAHAMFLEDPGLIDAMETVVRERQINAEIGVLEAAQQYAAAFEAMDDDYFRARAADVRDVCRRVLACLMGVDESQMAFPNEPIIVVAEDLAPSDTMRFDPNLVLGMVTIKGGPTSHTAILARSLGIPAVVSTPLVLDDIGSSSRMVINGDSGLVLLNPDSRTVETARDLQEAWQLRQSALVEGALHPVVTIDGHAVEIVANVGSVDDATRALELGAEGIGLFRTEFLYLERSSMPTEAQQIEAYRAVFEVMGNRPVVVRTLDIGGDKAVSFLGLKEEPNPFLGWRAIRMINERPEVLKTQLRALLVAGVKTDLRIMVPLVSNRHEVRQARTMLDEALQELAAEGVAHQKHPQFGIMVEVPSAALMAHHIAPLVDFFSIGTNDLTQYTLAVDRMNERVAHLASPFHPAVLQLIKLTLDAAHAQGKWVGLCGEFGGDPLAAPLLLGMGLDEFSMSASAIPAVKEVLRLWSLSDARLLAQEVLKLATTEQVTRYLEGQALVPAT